MKMCLNNRANHENLDLSCFFCFFLNNQTKKKTFQKLFHFLLPLPVMEKGGSCVMEKGGSCVMVIDIRSELGYPSSNPE